MKKVEIKEPVWRDRSISVAEYHYNDTEEVEISCTYTNKQGKRLWPHGWVIHKRDFLNCPVTKVAGYKARKIFLPQADA